MGFVSYKEMAGLMGVTVESFHEVFEALLKVGDLPSSSISRALIMY